MVHDKPLRLLMITGMSGSGKTSVVHALEDMGLFCIDNLPVPLFPGLLDLLKGGALRSDNVALVMDIREKSFLQEFPGILEKIRKNGVRPEILFLDASTEILIRRFKETRRPHPLAGEQTLLEGIEQERKQLLALKQSSDRVIDTSHFNIHQIRQYMSMLFGTTGKGEKQLQIELISFSYAKGTPFHTDLIMDVRFLPNPHYDPELRERDGRDPKIQEVIQSDRKSSDILEKFIQWVESMVSFYEEEDRAYFNMGVGCTGGKHRSVAVVCLLERRLKDLGYLPKVLHRDL